MPDARRITRIKAEPSRLTSTLPCVAFNKDAFSKCPQVMNHLGRIKSACPSKRDVLQVNIRAQSQAFVRFAVSSCAALSAFAPNMTCLLGTFDPVGISRETPGSNPKFPKGSHDPKPTLWPEPSRS
jgi:hypothetical protein